MRNSKVKNKKKIILFIFSILFLAVITIGFAPVSFDSIILKKG